MDFMKELVAFCREKGYIWGPSPEIYGGLSGFYTYGPLGKLLKNNVEETIRTVFNQQNLWEVECPTVMQREVWEASGHLSGFTDPLVKDVEGGLHRADHLIEEHCRTNNLDPDKVLGGKTSNEEFLALIKEHKVKANGKDLVPEIMNHNLMMRTTIGMETEAYNRPETATTTYLPFPLYFDYFRKTLPFGVFQIGKAYRNEISPRQFVLRMREFTQAEAQIFLFADQKDSYAPYDSVKDEQIPVWDWTSQENNGKVQTMTVAEARKKFFKNDAYAYTVALAYNVFTSIGIPAEAIRLRQHGPDEKAFYADDAWDVEVKLKSFGWMEMCGIHDRTDYDLKQHQEHSKKKLAVSDENHKKELPHVLEIAFGTDRATFCLLDLLFNPQDVADGKTTFAIPGHIAPIKAAVFPLVKKDGMPEKATEVYQQLSKEFVCTYDASGSIGRRYLRAAEQGIPYCVTIDGDTASDNTVTLRDRDTEEQKRVPIEALAETLQKLLAGKADF